MTNLPKAVGEFWKTYYLDICGGAEFSFQINSDIASNYTEILLTHPNSPIRNLIMAAKGILVEDAYFDSYERLLLALAKLEMDDE